MPLDVRPNIASVALFQRLDMSASSLLSRGTIGRRLVFHRTSPSHIWSAVILHGPARKIPTWKAPIHVNLSLELVQALAYRLELTSRKR
jgi:hypothetical protein